MKLEETVLTAKTSRWVALGFLAKKPMLIYLLIMILALIIPFVLPEYGEVLYLGLGLAGLYFLMFLGRLFGFKREKIDLTNHRLIIYRSYGSIETRIMVLLHQVVQVEVNRGKLARFLGYGDMKIMTSGNSKVDLESISKIENFQEALHIEMMKSLDKH
ncbi:MAG: PH domain-containing protein [Candidatus Izemoplasmataceae bacterium]